MGQRRKSLYELTKAPEDFKWAGKNTPELPILCDRDGTIWEPAMLFFGSSAWYNRVKISSMQDEASILREWKTYLDDQNIQWDAVSDQVMINWRENLKDQKNSGNTRINRKLETVFTFYDKAKFYGAMKTDLVSPTGPITCLDQDLLPIGKRGAIRKRKSNSRQWACAEASKGNNNNRPTPDMAGVNAVLANLRDSRKNTHTGMRDWLLARIMAEAGLRNEEVRGLTVIALENAIKQAGVKIPQPASIQEGIQQGWKKRKYDLDCISEWEKGKEKLIKDLDCLRRGKNQTHIYVEVVGKGNKRRYAPFPLELITNLIDTAIWYVRLEQSRQWEMPVLPNEIFLSNRKKPLQRKTVTNLIKTAFNEEEVDGSGHRLRAYFATSYSEQLWIKYLKMNLFRSDQTIENEILSQLTDALGHSTATTTIKHYLDLGRAAHLNNGTDPKIRAMRRVADSMIDHNERTASEFFEVIKQLIDVHDKVSNENDRSELINALTDMVSIFTSTADTTNDGNNSIDEPPKSTKPRLHIVPK